MRNEERLSRYMEARSPKEVESKVLSERVEAVAIEEKCMRTRPKEVAVDEKSTEVKSNYEPKPVSGKPRKRRHNVATWHERSFAIFMFLHKQIFNSNVYTTSDVLGIPRSTLLTWTSKSVKSNIVHKWFDIVANLSWGQVKEMYKDKIRDMFQHVDEDSKVDLSEYRVFRGNTIVLSQF